ncbi:MAG: helix-turn-helix domain-containing protein [Akkermansiaceae bacterium]
MADARKTILDETFFTQHPLASDLASLFDHLPNVIFYAKDRESRFVAANSVMAEAKPLEDPRSILGCTDYDFHPPALADAYVAEDRRVMDAGRGLPNQLWFVLDHRGRPGWFNSSKAPLRDQNGNVVGIAGVRYAVEAPHEAEGGFKALAPVIRHLEEHYAENVPMKAMADLAGLSSTHFNRSFKDLFGVTPTRFLHSMRIEKARQLLANTARQVGEIAHETGFHDQSHFTRHFKRQTGMTPRSYRVRFRTAG